eukprot:scaffold80508_cov60-Attheya_sp.AAC.9
MASHEKGGEVDVTMEGNTLEDNKNVPEDDVIVMDTIMVTPKEDVDVITPPAKKIRREEPTQTAPAGKVSLMHSLFSSSVQSPAEPRPATTALTPTADARTSIPSITAETEAAKDDTVPVVVKEEEEEVQEAVPSSALSSSSSALWKVKLEQSEEERYEEFRKRRKRRWSRWKRRQQGTVTLTRVGQPPRPETVPSFVAMIRPDDSDDDNDDNHNNNDSASYFDTLQRRKKHAQDLRDNQGLYFIDVDACLGLLDPPSSKPSTVVVSPVPTMSLSTTHLGPSTANQSSPITSTGPWFEGVRSLALPKDAQYLSELHCLIRSNLEIFTATDAHVSSSTPVPTTGTTMPNPSPSHGHGIGTWRRTPVLKQRVGVRCIHCAMAGDAGGDSADTTTVSSSPTKLKFKKGRRGGAMVGSVSYPQNVAGLYPICLQKPTLHFGSCPHLPLSVQAQLHKLTVDPETGEPLRQRHSTGAISAQAYYILAAQRMGLVDVGKGGIRLSRDPTSPLLPMDQVYTHSPKKLTPRADAIASMSAPFSGSSQQALSQPTKVLPRIPSDTQSEQVLTQAIAECNSRAKEMDGKEDSTVLVLPQDKDLVTDLVFLLANQMEMCHANEGDFVSRGKTTKTLRLGFTGLACRHCHSGRSFASAPDNLASAISASFYGHVVLKCDRTPLALRQALAAFKKLHARQMARLVYGSQRRFFQLVWSRLRRLDQTDALLEDVDDDTLATSNPINSTQSDATPTMTTRGTGGAVPKSNPTDEVDEIVAQESSSSPSVSVPAPSIQGPDAVASTSVMYVPPRRHISTTLYDNDDLLARRTAEFGFPVCDDETTNQILKEALNEPIEVYEGLLEEGDRAIVSDYVFMILKQMKMIHLTEMEFSRSSGFRVGMAGICCRHCSVDKGGKTYGTGRSFPTAPDNIASTVNSSIYNHIQKCPNVSTALKQAFVNLKRMHPMQLAALPFGSQRRFFQFYFSRLRAGDLKSLPLNEDSSQSEPQHSTTHVAEPVVVEKILDVNTIIGKYSFMKGPSGCFVCKRCRMVPLELRADKSIFLEACPTTDSMKQHFHSCQENAFDISRVVQLVRGMVLSIHGFGIDSLVQPAFRNLVKVLVGENERLVKVFTEGVLEADCQDDDSKTSSFDTRGLWSEFPPSVNLQEANEALASFLTSVPAISPSTFLQDADFVSYVYIIAPAFTSTLSYNSSVTKKNEEISDPASVVD